MKPIPPELLALYPQGPGAPVPGRPWWRKGTAAFKRSDGRVVGGDSMRWVDDDSFGPELVEAAIVTDRNHPLPHPGFRVGQVWGCVEEGGVIVRQISRERSGMLVVIEDGASHRAYRRKEMPFLEGPEFSAEAVRRGWMLLADPCCPWLAPWSPS